MSLKTPPSSPIRNLSNSPKTPVKSVTTSKNKTCLACGVIFELSGQKSYYNVFTSAGLEEIIKRVLGESPNYVYESEKVCKRCYRRLESLDRRLVIFRKDKQALLSLYRTNKENKKGCDGRFKRQSKDGLTADMHRKRQSLLKPRTVCFDSVVETDINKAVHLGSSLPLDGNGGENQSYAENIFNKPAKVTVSSLFLAILQSCKINFHVYISYSI